MDPVSFRKLQKFSMRRSPRWRYERIRSLLDSRVRTGPSQHDDKLVRRGLKFISHWDSLAKKHRDYVGLTEARQLLFAKDPEMYLVYEIVGPEEFEKLRHAIEARILARQTDHEIAQRFGTLPDVINLYEQLFFNVRDRLDNPDYIINSVIAPSVGSGYETVSTDFSSKFFGYFAGKQVLDVILTGFDNNVQLPTSKDTCETFFDNHFGNTLRRRAAEAINTFEVNKFNVLHLFEIHANLISAAKKAKEQDEELSVIEKSIDLLLKAVPFSVGESRKKSLSDSPLKNYYGHAGELRASELMDISAGKSIVVPDLSSFKIPDQRSE